MTNPPSPAAWPSHRCTTTAELRVALPWHRPSSPYHDDGLDCLVRVNDHLFKVSGTGQYAMSGRSLWCVECVTCGVVLHIGTTSAAARISSHLDLPDQSGSAAAEPPPAPPNDLQKFDAWVQAATELMASVVPRTTLAVSAMREIVGRNESPQEGDGSFDPKTWQDASKVVHDLEAMLTAVKALLTAQQARKP
jgi:hypothetical protein